MRFAVDHHFRIGRLHESAGTPCQDYAVSGHDADGAYAIVTDGCSSGGRTDVGARLLAHALAAHPIGDPFRVIECARKLLALVPEDMLATSAVIHCDNGGARMHLLGDGVFAYVRRSGGLHIEQMSWAGNTPFYPAYDGETLSRFIDLHSRDERCLRIDVWDIECDTTVHRVETRCVLEAIPGIVRTFDREQMRDIALLAVLSDGAAQVDAIEAVDSVCALLRFRAPAGRFVARRLNRFLRDAEQLGRGALDDIAMAVVRLEHDHGEAPAARDASIESGGASP